MGLITGLLTLPLAPLRGVVAVAEAVRNQAEEEFYDPVRIREQLAGVQRQREAGELTDDEATRMLLTTLGVDVRPLRADLEVRGRRSA